MLTPSRPSPSRLLPVEPLEAATFRPFGELIAPRADATHYPINDGFAERYHDLARIDATERGGWPCLSIFSARPRQLPLLLTLLERHPLGSQTFMPLSALPYLLVVAPPGEVPDLAQLRCFAAAPGQGVNYARGVWHHPLIALQAC